MVGVRLLDVAAELLELHVYELADLVHLGLELHQPRVVVYVLVHLLVLPRAHRLQPRQPQFRQLEGLLAGLAPGEVVVRVALVPGLALLAELAVVVAAGRPADRDEGEAVIIAASLGHLHPINYKNNNDPSLLPPQLPRVLPLPLALLQVHHCCPHLELLQLHHLAPDSVCLLLRPERALPLVPLDVRVGAGPLAAPVRALGHQIIDDVERDEVLLQLALEPALAEGTGFVVGRPVFDADVAEGMAEYGDIYPQAVLTGSSKTSWQMLQRRWVLIDSGLMKLRRSLDSGIQ